MTDLSPRQQSLLNRVVETHIETAQPVGSRFITSLYTEIYRDSYSSATVRAEMGHLEEKGYLTHPHPSAGRVPTDLGYRYYVDYGVKAESSSEDMLRQVSRQLSETAEESEVFAENASRILSQLTEEVSLIVISNPQDSETRSPRRYRLFFQGSSRMLEKPEFQDLNKARAILNMLEEKTDLAHWLTARAPEAGVSVTIGHENEPEAFQQCSVVSASCGVRGRNLGAVAILGPRRMKYSKAMPLVAQVGQIMRRVLEDADSRELF